jgi:hypothetical protein
MRLLGKIFLLLAVLFFGMSYTPFGRDTLHGIPLPLAVIFFGCFIIAWGLPRQEFDQFEKDQALRNQLIINERKQRRRRRLYSRVRWKAREAHP